MPEINWKIAKDLSSVKRTPLSKSAEFLIEKHVQEGTLTGEIYERLTRTQVEEFADEVEAALNHLRVGRIARQLHNIELTGEPTRPPEVGWSAADELDLEEPDLVHLIDDLHITPGITELIAYHKTGKTRLALTVAGSLIDRQAFLGIFPVQFEGNVGYLNYELSKWTFRRWIRQAAYRHPERLFPWHLRGKPPVAFWLPGERERLIEWILGNDLKFLIIDTVKRAGRNLVKDWNDDTAVGEFFDQLREVMKLAECEDALLLHHMGRASQKPSAEGREHARGSTALEDEPDVLWYLVKDRSGQRYLRAIGRDVELPETAVDFDNATGLYGSRGQAKTDLKADQQRLAVLRVVSEHDGLSTRQLLTTLGGRTSDGHAAIQSAVQDGYLRTKPKGQATLHYITVHGHQYLSAAGRGTDTAFPVSALKGGGNAETPDSRPRDKGRGGGRGGAGKRLRVTWRGQTIRS
jgi:AAA domain